jgi:CRP-like cAMP-binding protein
MSKRQLAKYPPRSDRNVPTRHDGARGLLNKILLALPPNEYALLFPKLTLINLQLHDVLQEPGQQIKFAYFPNTAMSSVLNLMADGKCVEVGLVGTEGMVGMPLMANLNSSPNLTVIQAPGTLFRIKAQEFRAILPDCPQLNRELVHYAQVVALEIMQIAACNRLHEFHERLARWLLMSEDRISSHVLPLTEEFLAQMLGTRRASVSVAFSILRKARLIKHSRSQIIILDRKGLEEASCECYKAIRTQLAMWRDESKKDAGCASGTNGLSPRPFRGLAECQR